MKLVDAKERIREIETRLENNTIRLRLVPVSAAADLLDECNALLSEKDKLCSSIKKTEEDLVIQGNNFSDVVHAHQIISQKITLLESLEFRNDLLDGQALGLRQQLKEFRTHRDALAAAIDGCLWEKELLVD